MTNPQSQISGGGDRPEDTNDDAQGLGQRAELDEATVAVEARGAPLGPAGKDEQSPTHQEHPQEACLVVEQERHRDAYRAYQREYQLEYQLEYQRKRTRRHGDL